MPNTTTSSDRSGDKATGKIFAGYNIDKTWATIVTAFNQAKAGEPVVLELTER